MLKFEPFDYTTMDLPSDLQLGAVGTPGLFFDESESSPDQDRDDACDGSPEEDAPSEAEEAAPAPEEPAFGGEDTTLCCLDAYAPQAVAPQAEVPVQAVATQIVVTAPPPPVLTPVPTAVAMPMPEQAPLPSMQMQMQMQQLQQMQQQLSQQIGSLTASACASFDLSGVPLGSLAQAGLTLPPAFQTQSSAGEYAVPLSLAALAAPLTPPARLMAPPMCVPPTATTPSGQPQQIDQAKPFACRHEGCTARFASDRSRKRHEKAHAGDRPFACTWPGCPRRFARRSDLTVHERVHTGERPYACEAPGCGKRFTRSSDLRIHERIHGEERPYACAVPGCCATFKRRSDLRKHDRVHTQHPTSCCATPAPQAGAAQMYAGAGCAIDAAAAAVAAAGMLPPWVVKQEPVSFEIPEACSMGSGPAMQMPPPPPPQQQQAPAMLPLKLGFNDFF